MKANFYSIEFALRKEESLCDPQPTRSGGFFHISILSLSGIKVFHLEERSIIQQVGIETEHQILGISSMALTVAVFNAVIYGVILWLVYTLADKFGLIPKGRRRQLIIRLECQ